MNPTVQNERQEKFQETLVSARRTMLMSEILKLAGDSFRASKTRFALTALGMVIGTASVILVVTIGMTGKQYILELIQKIGTNTVEVEYSGGGATAAERVRYNDFLTREDEKAVDQQVPGVMYSSPVLTMHNRISFPGGIQKDTVVLGVTPEYQQIRNLIVTVGRFFDQTDDSAHIKCAVVTQQFAKEQYGSDDLAIGQTFQVLGIPFTIIGVFKESVSDFGQSEIQDETVLVPYTVARYFTGTDRVNQIYFSLQSMNEVPEAAREIVHVISSSPQHRPDSTYKAQTLSDLLVTAAEIADALTVVLVMVAAVTLAVGGVGIMNAWSHIPRDQAAVPHRGCPHLAHGRNRGERGRTRDSVFHPHFERLRLSYFLVVGGDRADCGNTGRRDLRNRSRDARRAARSGGVVEV
jgi:putative ABC transport system permease protein